MNHLFLKNYIKDNICLTFTQRNGTIEIKMESLCPSFGFVQKKMVPASSEDHVIDQAVASLHSNFVEKFSNSFTHD